MSLKQFKWIDLFLFSLIALIFEIINHFASINLQYFKLAFMSFTIVLTLIAMYRWGIAGVIVLVLASLVGVAISPHNGEYQHYVTYVCGGILGMLPGFLIFQLLIGKKRIKNPFLMLSYLLFDFVMVILCRSLILALFYMSDFASEFSNNIKGLLVQESMSFFISSMILLVANRKSGKILVEMRQYVKEVHEMKKLGNLKEMKESPKFNSDSSFTEFGQIDNSTILDGGTMNVDQLKELEKMYKESDKINIDNPLDCLAEKTKKEDSHVQD